MLIGLQDWQYEGIRSCKKSCLCKIYEEFQMDLTWHEWLALYQEATRGKHDFLFLDMYGPDDMRMRKGFDKALMYFDDKDVGVDEDKLHDVRK